MNRYLLAVAALCAATAISDPAQSAEPPVMRVRLEDLDLQTPAGAHTALKRIQLATSQFCWERNATDAGRHVQMRACRKDMLDRSIAQLAAPQVTALYTAPDRRARATLLAAR